VVALLTQDLPAFLGFGLSSDCFITTVVPTGVTPVLLGSASSDLNETETSIDPGQGSGQSERSDW